jgi:hypothetical protein
MPTIVSDASANPRYQHAVDLNIFANSWRRLRAVI